MTENRGDERFVLCCGFAESGASEHQLRLSLDDLLNAETKGLPTLATHVVVPVVTLSTRVAGRWWLTGAAWKGAERKAPASSASSSSSSSSKRGEAKEDDSEGLGGTGSAGDDLLALAKQQRMNTEVRRAVFCVIMSGQVG